MTHQPTRPRHLMDPDNPRPPASRSNMSLDRVQRWVMSVLAVTTILHLGAGVMVAAFTLGDVRAGAETGLVVISGFCFVGAVVTGLAIHRRPVLSPWLLLGLAPPAVALVVLHT